MKLTACVVLIVLLFSCKTDEISNRPEIEELTTLQSQVEQMKVDAELKDSLINESLSFFNEIQNNLIAIGTKEQSVRLKSQNSELANDEKAMVLDEIKQINYLRDENAKKMTQMKESMKSGQLKISEFEKMIAELQKDITERDEQIALLQADLEQKNEDYAMLFDAFQEKDFEVEKLSEELNVAFYVYGTESEMVKNGVLDRKNGFIGIGKKVGLKQDFNEEYFTQLDIRTKKEILITGSNVQLISTHKSSSYEFKASGKNTKLIIKDPTIFWKITKYLIVVVK